MQFGLVISVLLHLAVLGWAVLTIQTQRELRIAEPEPIAVDLLTPSEVTKVRQGVRTAKQMDAEAKETPKPEISKKEAPKPTPVATPKPEPPKPEPPKEEVKEAPKPEPPKPEPPKEVAKVEPPKLPEPAKDPIAEKLAAERPDPAIEQAKKLEEERQEEARRADELKKAEEQRKAEEDRKADEHRKAEEHKRLEQERRQKEAELKKKKEDEARKRKESELKKKKEDEKRLKEAEAKRQKTFDDQMREMQALLNKVPDKGAPLPNTPQEEPSKNKGPVLGSKEGRDNRLSASEIAVLGQIIRSCVQSKWNVLGGGEAAQHTEVKMRLRFNVDGTLAAEPQVTNQQGTPFFLAMSDSAVRAVKACEPFPLPAPKYEFWRDMILTFKPNDMF